jgi:hypothetical protein
MIEASPDSGRQVSSTVAASEVLRSEVTALEAATYDLALVIMALETQHGRTATVVRARSQLQQMDEHLGWLERHGRDAPLAQLREELDFVHARQRMVVEMLAAEPDTEV